MSGNFAGRSIPIGVNGYRVRVVHLLMLVPVLITVALAGMGAASAWGTQKTDVANLKIQVAAMDETLDTLNEKADTAAVTNERTRSNIESLDRAQRDYRDDNNARLERQEKKLDRVLELLIQSTRQPPQ